MWHVLDNIYLSDLQNSLDPTNTRAHKITTVVRLSDPRTICLDPSTYPSSVKLYDFEVEDNARDRTQMIWCSKIIKDIVLSSRPNVVLICCAEGRSSSVSVVIYYLMTAHKWSYERSLQWIKKRNPGAEPNHGFEAALRAFDSGLRS